MSGRFSINQHQSLPWTWQRLGFFAVVAGFIDVLLMLAGARHSVQTMLAPFIGVFVVTISGEWLLALVGPALTAVLPAAFVTGAAAMMMAMLALSSLFNVTAQTAFIICALLIALTYLACPVARHAIKPVSSQDIPATLFLAVLIGYFCRDVAAFFPSATAGGALPIWTDYYVHGTVIASFGDPLAVKEGNILLAHAPRPFYHYGSFMLPAALLPASGLPGLALALATLLPLGLLIGALGLYALLAQMTSRAMALFVVLCVACLPDASYYWMQNGFYGFRWLLYTAPGSGYALGVAAMAATCLLHGLRTKKQASNALGLFLLLSLFMIRLHFFVLLAPAFAGTWLLAQWRISPRKKALLACLSFALAFVASISLLSWQPGLRAMLQPIQYAEGTLNFGPPDYLQFLQHTEASMPLAASLALLVAMLLAATLGVLLIGLPLVTAVWARSGRWEDFDWLPWLLCVAYSLLILLAPTGLNTDASELKHRHFILLYAIAGAWSIARSAQWASQFALNDRRVDYVLWPASAAVLLLTMTLGRDVNPGKPSLIHMPWASGFFDVPVAPGIAQTGAYIRAHSEQGDLMVMSGEAMRGYMQSRQTELIGFADVATYLGRTELLEKQRGIASTLASERAAEVNNVVTAAAWAAACARLNQMGVRWYVENQAGLPSWDPSHSEAVFSAAEFSIYDAGSEPRSRCNNAAH
ncbi:hypothetical protein [Dyella sp. Tek66A03]|uniref:hypothetical protein n=1 Tax=Dyella sp. Tek66A03 TaxID=3458298 RepID=UPI00403E61D2